MRSESAPESSTTYACVLGLTGLALDAGQTPDWATTLSASDVEKACRYACHELNGFPTWLPTLLEAAPTLVSNVLLKEISYELSQENAENSSTYVLYDVRWAGQWIWAYIAPDLYKLLKRCEPKNLANLGYLLNILEGSSISDDEIATLAARKCTRLKRRENLSRWFATWVATDPGTALPQLEVKLGSIPNVDERTVFAMQFITQLLNSRYGNAARFRQGFISPYFLQRLYLLMHKVIVIANDTKRAGVYSPGLRKMHSSFLDTVLEGRDGHGIQTTKTKGRPSILFPTFVPI